MNFFSGSSAIEPAEIVNQLFPNLWIFIAHLIATIILLVLMTKWVYNPFRKMMRARRKFIQDKLDDAVSQQQKATNDRKEMEKILSNAKTKANAIIMESKTDAEDQKLKIINIAHEEAFLINKNAKQSIDEERKKSEEEIRKSIIDIAFNIADKVLEEEISVDKHNKIIDDFINNID